MLLTSRNNPTIKKLVSLQEKKFRKEHGEYLVEGEKPVKEAIACNLSISALFLSETAFQRGGVDIPANAPLYLLTDDLFARVSTEKAPQGVMATVKMPSASIERPKGNCLLLDGVSDPGNMGAIIRTANASGYDELYLLNCTDPYAPKAVRASMSGVFHTKLSFISEEDLDWLFDGIPLIVADLDGENLFNFNPPDKFCLCIGNEGHGLCENTKKRATHTVTIPMRKSQESLNASVSAGICMYWLTGKQWKN